MTVSPDDSLPRFDQIAWSHIPTDPLERFIDPASLSDDELLVYCTELQRECRWVRALLHVALEQVARLTAQLTRAARVADHLRATLAQLREHFRQ